MRRGKADSVLGEGRGRGRPQVVEEREVLQTQVDPELARWVRREVTKWREAARDDPSLRIGTTGKRGRLPDSGDLVTAAILFWRAKVSEDKRLPRDP